MITATQTTAEDLVRQLITSYNNRDFETGIALIAEGAEQRDMALGSLHVGPEGRRAIFVDNATMFSDSKTEIIEVWPSADGMSCAFLAVFTGTHDGDFPPEEEGGEPTPATHKPLRIEFMAIVRTKDGKITVADKYYDSAEYSKQLGV